LERGFVCQGGVFAARVVVGVDVGEDLGAGVVGVDEGAVLEPFGFQSAHRKYLKASVQAPTPTSPAALLLTGKDKENPLRAIILIRHPKHRLELLR